MLPKISLLLKTSLIIQDEGGEKKKRHLRNEVRVNGEEKIWIV